MKKDSITEEKVRYMIKRLSDDQYDPTPGQIKKSESNLLRYLRLGMIKNKDLDFPNNKRLRINEGVIVLSIPTRRHHASRPTTPQGIRPSNEYHHKTQEKKETYLDVDTKDYLVREIID